MELAQGWSHDLGLSEVIHDDKGQAHVVPSAYCNPQPSTPDRGAQLTASGEGTP